MWADLVALASRKRPRTEDMLASTQRSLQRATVQNRELVRRCDLFVDFANQERLITRELHATNNGLHVRAMESENALAEERASSIVDLEESRRRIADIEDQRNHATCAFAQEALHADKLRDQYATLTQSSIAAARVQQSMECDLRRVSLAHLGARSHAYRASRDACKYARLANDATRGQHELNLANADLHLRMQQNLDENRMGALLEWTNLARIRQDHKCKLKDAVELAVQDERVRGQARLIVQEDEHIAAYRGQNLEHLRVRDDAVIAERERGNRRVGIACARAALELDTFRQHDMDEWSTRCERIRLDAADQLNVESERLASAHAISLAYAVEMERARGQTLLDLAHKSHETTIGAMEIDRIAADVRAAHTLKGERERASDLLIVTNQAAEDTLLQHTAATSLLTLTHQTTIASMQGERNEADMLATQTLQNERDRASEATSLLTRTHETTVVSMERERNAADVLSNQTLQTERDRASSILNEIIQANQDTLHLIRATHAQDLAALMERDAQECDRAHIHLLIQQAFANVIHNSRIATFVEQNAASIEELRNT
jgi:hypothetical protein